MRKALLLAALLLFGCSEPAVPQDRTVGAAAPQTAVENDQLTAASCGVERWAVKTLTDPAASRVNLTPVASTVQALRLLPAPAQPSARAGVELRTFTVRATITAYKQEADSDVHLAVVDAKGLTMIFEMPAAKCLGASPQRARMTAAQAAWDARYPVSTTYRTVRQPVTVTGVAFFDRIHGQRGVAPNGIELHPLTSLTFG